MVLAAAAMIAGCTVKQNAKTPQASAPVTPASAAPAPKPSAGPVASVENTSYKAGNVRQGELITHKFFVKNTGDAVLHIKRVQPSCGCTVTKWDHEVAPGKTGTILATVHTDNFMGPIHKTVFVTTDDPHHPSFQLSITADVQAILNISPEPYGQFGIVYTGKTPEKEFTIHSTDGTPFQITQVQSQNGKLPYTVKQENPTTVLFKVKVPPDYPVGPIQGRFVLDTTHPKARQLHLSVFGTERNPLTVWPKELVFHGLSLDYIRKNAGNPSLTAALTGTINVSFQTAPKLQIKSVRSSLPFLHTTFNSTRPNQSYSIQVKIDPARVKVGRFDGTITIRTNMKTIKVPVSGQIF